MSISSIVTGICHPISLSIKINHSWLIPAMFRQTECRWSIIIFLTSSKNPKMVSCKITRITKQICLNSKNYKICKDKMEIGKMWKARDLLRWILKILLCPKTMEPDFVTITMVKRPSTWQKQTGKSSTIVQHALPNWPRTTSKWSNCPLQPLTALPNNIIPLQLNAQNSFPNAARSPQSPNTNPTPSINQSLNSWKKSSP